MSKYKNWQVEYLQGTDKNYIRNLSLPDAKAIVFCLERNSIQARTLPTPEYSAVRGSYGRNTK